MKNAKEELLDTIGSNIKTLRCATITHSPFDWRSNEVPLKKIVLKEGYSQADLDEFISKLDFEYDAGYGSQELFGIVWFNDGYWMDRYEYDGSERWDWHKYPTIPDELKEISFPDPKDITDDYAEMMIIMETDEEYNNMINNEYDEQVYDEPEINTDYVIASTNEMLQETMVFPANEHGQITQYTDLTSIALRNGHEYWEDAFAAVILLNTDEYKYIHVRTLESDKNIHNLFKKINTSDTVVI